MGNSVAQWSGPPDSPKTVTLVPFTPYEPGQASSPRSPALRLDEENADLDPAIRPTMNSVLDELKRRFSRDDFPGKTLEESWIVINSEPPGESSSRRALLRSSGGTTTPKSTTLAWVSNGTVSFVSYFKPPDSDADGVDAAASGAAQASTGETAAGLAAPSAEPTVPPTSPAVESMAVDPPTPPTQPDAPSASASAAAASVPVPDMVVIPPDLEDQLRELKEKVEQLQQLRSRMDELSQSLVNGGSSPLAGRAQPSSFVPAATAAGGASSPAGPAAASPSSAHRGSRAPRAFTYFYDYAGSPSLSPQSSTDEIVVEDTAAPPPPPPPPPPGPGAKVAICSVPLLRRQEKAAPRTRPQLEQAVRELVGQSDVTESNKERAVGNFLQAFPDPKANAALDTLVTSYAFLVRSMPLHPKTCYSRMKVWEDNLFKKVDDKQAKDIRKKKTIEIEKLDTEEKILGEIKRIFDHIEALKRKEAERQAEVARRALAGDVLQELKAKHRALEQRSQSQLANLELQSMEQGEIEFD